MTSDSPSAPSPPLKAERQPVPASQQGARGCLETQGGQPRMVESTRVQQHDELQITADRRSPQGRAARRGSEENTKLSAALTSESSVWPTPGSAQRSSRKQRETPTRRRRRRRARSIDGGADGGTGGGGAQSMGVTASSSPPPPPHRHTPAQSHNRPVTDIGINNLFINKLKAR